MKVVMHIMLAATSLFMATHAEAQTLRCGNSVVGPGDTKTAVLQKCGEPVMKETFCKAAEPQTVANPQTGATIVNVLPCENVDDWTYNPGQGKFMTTLRFREGTLRAITDGDRAR